MAATNGKPRRNTATRDRHRAVIARGEPPCALCGRPIDYTLPHLDALAYVVDHVVALAAGGDDTLANKQAAHRGCNRDKGDKAFGSAMRRTPGIVRPG